MTDVDPPAYVQEALFRELQQLDLSPYQARVLVALLRLGAGNSAQVARHSGVPRTSTYQVMEELSRNGLAQRLSVDGPATWAAAGRDEVLDRLEALQEERLRLQRERTARIRAMFTAAFPDAPAAGSAYVHVLPAAQVAGVYRRLLAETSNELLLLNQPSSKAPEEPNDAVLEALERGVTARALYQADHWRDRASREFREAMDVYHRAGVRPALVEELPIELAVGDRRIALVSMTDPVVPDSGLASTLLVEHPGFAWLAAAAFDMLWAGAEELDVPPDGPRPRGSAPG